MKTFSSRKAGIFYPSSLASLLGLSVLSLTAFLLYSNMARAQQADHRYVLAIHGGSGSITPEKYPPLVADQYRSELRRTLQIGDSLLSKGRTCLDAVEACIRYMEDCPLFNAGRGAVFNAEGMNELDASIMDGRSGMAGAVAGITSVRHPISAARAVMEHSEHVMLSGKGAEVFALEQGLEIVDPSWFYTPQRWQEYLKIKSKADSLLLREEKHGTVGCVALDKYGNIAAGTSTGGMTYKKYGRIGDSPLIGAGTFADNQTCAVSATGHGEFFIRNVVAYDISALMKYEKLPLDAASSAVIHDKLTRQGGTGGVICIDSYGNIAMPFNTQGMFRGYIKEGESEKVFIFAGDGN